MAGAALAACLLPGQAAAQSLEYSVKASYLVRFAAFVSWPPRSFTSADAPLVLCVTGRDPFGAAMDRAVAGQTAHGRRLALRRPNSVAALAGCHIAYVGRETPTAWIDSLAAAPGALLVTDGAATRRGAVHFVLAENRVRFHIDQRAAQRAELNISSRLLNLALSVQG
jgi:hypothetical protein